MVTPECLSDEDVEAEGFVKHQCNGEYDLTISLELDPPFGAPITLGKTVTVLPVNESTYENPLVAVCCTDITDAPGWCEGAASCATPHQDACWQDHLAHICRGVGPWLRKIADEQPAGSLKRSAIHKAGDALAVSLRQECFDHFWSDTPDELSEQDFCDEEFDGLFTHTSWEPTDTWQSCSFGFCAVVSDVKVELETSSLDGMVVPPPAEPEECSSPFTNAGEIPPFPESGTPSGPWRTLLSAVSADVSGPEWKGKDIEGSGSFGTSSTLRAAVISSDLVIFDWRLEEHEATTVGTSSVSSDVSHFKAELMGDVTATTAPNNRYELAAGDAMFNLSATVDGRASSVQAKNSTTLLLEIVSPGTSGCPSQATSCLLSPSFEVEYIDPDNETWLLEVGAGVWPEGLVAEWQAEPGGQHEGLQARGCACSSNQSGHRVAVLLFLALVALRRRRSSGR